MVEYDLIIVTGGSRGIGKAVVNECCKFSKQLISIGSSAAIKNHNNISYLQFNLYDFKKFEIEIIKILESNNFKSVGLILCASQLGAASGIFNSDLDDWNDLFRINVLGNLSVFQFILKFINKKIRFKTIFFAGGGAAYGYPKFFGYSLTKVATVRSVENIALEFNQNGYDASIVAVAPGAVSTDMLAKVIENGGFVKTKTDISEPVNFVKNFLLDDNLSKGLNGRFVHVRDDFANIDFNNMDEDKFKLRRLE